MGLGSASTFGEGCARAARVRGTEISGRCVERPRHAVQSRERGVVGRRIAFRFSEGHPRTVDSHGSSDLGHCEGRAGAAVSAEAHRFSTPAVHELTPQELQRQRDLVRMSLLPAPRPLHVAT
jgi:hypothetical protein